MFKCAEYGVPEAFAVQMLKVAMTFSDDGRSVRFDKNEIPGMVRLEWRKLHPDADFSTTDFLAANPGVPENLFRAGVWYNLPDSAYAKASPTAVTDGEAKAGSVPSIEDLDSTYAGMTSVQQNLAKGLYDEARASLADMPYIAAAVYNRSRGPDNIQAVLNSGVLTGKRGADGEYLSFPSRHDGPANRLAWDEAMRQAREVFSKNYRPVTTATHFYAPKIVNTPKWAVGKSKLQIDGVAHNFYDDVPFIRPWVATSRPELPEQGYLEEKVLLGDNPTKIAKRLGIPVDWIMAWNGLTEESARDLRPGNKLKYIALPKGYVPMEATGKTVADELAAIWAAEAEAEAAQR